MFSTVEKAMPSRWTSLRNAFSSLAASFRASVIKSSSIVSLPSLLAAVSEWEKLRDLRGNLEENF